MSDDSVPMLPLDDLFLSQSKIADAVVEHAVDAILVIDQRGIIQWLNPATVRMFQFAESELLGQNVKLLMPSPYHEEHDSYLRNYLQGGLPKIIGIGREVTGRRRDGSTFPMHLAVNEIRLGASRIFVGVVRDITDLKEAQAALSRLNLELEQRVAVRTSELETAQAELVKQERLATLGQLAGGIAHEIRNPLNALKTSAFYLCHAKIISPEKLLEHLERIDRQVNLIDNVVSALVDVARLPDPLLRPLEISGCWQAAVQSVSLTDKIQIENQLEGNLPAVLADARQLEIVFRNLIRNARDAMPQGGTIRLSAMVDSHHIRISVSDSGIGIPAEILPRITEPFFSTKARGIGLGLAITKRIMERNRGELEISSTVGIGTCFTLVLQRG